MDLKTFKEEFLLRPEQIIIIDKSLDLNGEEIYLLALTYDKKCYSLWTLDCMVEESNDINEVIDTISDTNRDVANRNRMHNTRFIESLEVDGHVFEFDRSSSEAFVLPGNPVYHRLQYFIDEGIELSHWDHISLSKMKLTKVRQSTFVTRAHLRT